MLESRRQQAEGRRQTSRRLASTRQKAVGRRQFLLTVFCLLLSAHCLLPTDVARAEELKVGYVDLAKLFDGYQRTKESDAALGKTGKQKEAELEGRMNDLKKLRQNLELLNDQAREAKVREIEEKQDELQRFRRDAARDLRQQRDGVAKEILKEIDAAVTEYAKANGFSLVLDERSLVYGQAAQDLTDEILKRLNSRSSAIP